MAMDKNLAKEMYRLAGLKVANWQMASPADVSEPAGLAATLNLPVVIKPVRQGSSLGMSIAHDIEELGKGLAMAFDYDDEVMVEEFIRGREITCGVIGNNELNALPLVEIIPGEEYPFFDYQAKYEPGASKEVCPAELDEGVTRRAQEFGLKAHRALKLKGYSRTDMMVAEDGEIYVIETNTVPGMTPTSLLPQAAKAFGLGFSELIDRLIELAME